MSSLEVLAEYVAAVRFAELPQGIKDKLAMHLFDSIAALMVGRTTADGKALARLVGLAAASALDKHPRFLSRPPAGLRAFYLSATMRCTEIDDIHLESCTTPGSVVVSTALALAECCEGDLTSDTFLAALLAGYEAMTRLGKAADGPRILYEGIWPTAFVAAAGSAATAARIRDMAPDQTAHALSSAMALAPVLEGPPEGALTSRWLKLGSVVQQGVLAAFGSEIGLRSDVAILDRAGLGQRCVPIQDAALVAGLGKSYETDRLSIKPYCAAKQATSAICGFLDIIDTHALDIESITHVEVFVPSFYAGMIGVPGAPDGRLASIASARYQLALAAKHRAALRDVGRESITKDEDFLRFMDLIRVSADPDLDEAYPDAWPARIEVMTGHRAFEKKVMHAKGDSTNPLGWEELVDKAHEAGSEIQGHEEWEVLAQICRKLGAGTGMRDLLEALDDVERRTEVSMRP